MIIARAPFRISLGGGGTDLPSYFRQYGGFVIGAAINKYVYISVNRRFYDSIRLSYSETEIVDSVDEIRHDIFRETFKFLEIDKQTEVASIADMPANSGLGSSSCFTVALLNALHAYKRQYVSAGQLAEEACDIEIGRLGQPIGKQDQYIASFGGITCLVISPEGQVVVEPLNLTEDLLADLRYRLLMFYTGVERKSGDILEMQDRKTRDTNKKTVDALHRIKDIGLKTRAELESGNIDALGQLMDEHWQVKRSLSNSVSNQFIDDCYKKAKESGAIGGKIMGAGGGGFFLLYVHPEAKGKLISALTDCGLRHVNFDFDFQGTKIVFNVTP